jgi:nitroreductase
MDLIDTLRSTGAARSFEAEPVADETLHRILDTARFAPNGGNRQAWRVVVVKDPAIKARLKDLYLPPWYEYLAMGGAGLTPWAPLGDRAEEQRAVTEHAAEIAANAKTQDNPGFAERLDAAPVLLVLLADLRRLVATDRDLGRYTVIAGASIYPFAWSVLLAARAEGLGGVMTTMHGRVEPEVKELLDIPEHLALAAVLAIGKPTPKAQPHKLRRDPVEQFATVDRADGPPFNPPSSPPQ